MKFRLTVRCNEPGQIELDAKPEEIERLMRQSTASPRASDLIAFLRGLDILAAEFNRKDEETTEE